MICFTLDNIIHVLMEFTDGLGVVWRMPHVPKDTGYPYSKRPAEDVFEYNFHFVLGGADSYK